MSIVPRTFPFTWMAMVTLVSTMRASLYSGQGTLATVPSERPSSSQHSSATCGAKGETSRVSASTASRAGAAWAARWLESTIICAMAVLKLSASTSSVTFLMVLCMSTVVSSSISSASSRRARLYTRSRNRTTPATWEVCQGLVASRGPMNISYRRRASAPDSCTTSSGLTTFPRLLLIFSLSLPRIIPWCTSFWKGSGCRVWPRS
mmetsp:Transcript_20064/g.31617  ORF Transcript_20064/g.31617 Transcript_20064/m.31617 type:complete len:206 (-) Transcript_20064:2349-2966(-)